MSTFTGILVQQSPRYANWRHILGDDHVPVKSQLPFIASFGGVETVEAFALDIARLTPEQRARLVDWIAGHFKVGRAGIEAELDKVGFPIRAADVSVAIDMRLIV